jgi:hypothetical protein
VRRPSGFIEPCPPSKVARPTARLRRLWQPGLAAVLNGATRLHLRKKNRKDPAMGAGDGGVVHVDKREFSSGREFVWTSILSRQLTARAPPCIGL